jgi:hypothetical protein
VESSEFREWAKRVKLLVPTMVLVIELEFDQQRWEEKH